MSDETIERALLESCDRSVECKGFGVHHPDCKRGGGVMSEVDATSNEFEGSVEETSTSRWETLHVVTTAAWLPEPQRTYAQQALASLESEWNDLNCEVDEALAEIERLREALREIVDQAYSECNCDDIARAALAGSAGGNPVEEHVNDRDQMMRDAAGSAGD